MKIVDAIFSPGKTGFYFDDQLAIKSGIEHDGFYYLGESVTPGFKNVRMAGESISIGLILENGVIVYGDAAAVQYSGTGGRDPLFLASDYIPFLEKHIQPLLQGLELDSFRNWAEYFDLLEIDGKRLHTAIRYGLSQALLEAHATANSMIACELICKEYDLPMVAEPIPIFGQSGDNRYEAVDKMILKEVEVLPHGLINNIPHKLGEKGEKLYDYIAWLVARINKFRYRDDYKPTLHLDVYGNIGTIFNYDIEQMVDYLATLKEAAGDYDLWIEGPVDMGERQLQIDTMHKLCREMRRRGVDVGIVADEWCNTYEDIVDFTHAEACDMVQIKTPDLGSIHNIVKSILFCKEHGMHAYQGGTCNETDQSARICTQVAMAARPAQILAKPGMGFDEGFAIVNNEMQRALAVLKHRTN